MDVPFLTTSSIENAALSLLHRYGTFAKPVEVPPVPAERICEDLLGLDIVPGDFECDFPEKQLRGAIGALDIDDQAIYVDEPNNQTSGRFNFTVAHEIGHHQLHGPILAANMAQQDIFANSDTNNIIVCRHENSNRPIEWQANQFGACLLMPKQLIIPFVKRIRETNEMLGHQPITYDSAVDPDDLISHVSTWFAVSKVAARIRLQDLHIIPKTQFQTV